MGGDGPGKGGVATKPLATGECWVIVARFCRWPEISVAGVAFSEADAIKRAASMGGPGYVSIMRCTESSQSFVRGEYGI